MASDVRYHSLFECDVREAAGWYRQRRASLGEEFIEAGIGEILAAPSRFATHEGVRYAQLARFPYIILFHVDEFGVLILALTHTSRAIRDISSRKDDRENDAS